MTENEYGFYANEAIDALQSGFLRNEYYDMTNIQRLKFLNELIGLIASYADYDVHEENA